MKLKIQNIAPENSAPPQWMLSLADLLSLILAFFVLIFATTNPTLHISKYDKQHDAEISAKKTELVTSVGIEKTNQDESTNYLYKIMKDKIMADKQLTSLNFFARDENLYIRATEPELNKIASKLAQLLKVVPNDVWVYSASLDTSAQIAQTLQNNGLDKKITYAQTASAKEQIDIVILP